MLWLGNAGWTPRSQGLIRPSSALASSRRRSRSFQGRRGGRRADGEDGSVCAVGAPVGQPPSSVLPQPVVFQSIGSQQPAPALAASMRTAAFSDDVTSPRRPSLSLPSPSYNSLRLCPCLPSPLPPSLQPSALLAHYSSNIHKQRGREEESVKGGGRDTLRPSILDVKDSSHVKMTKNDRNVYGTITQTPNEI